MKLLKITHKTYKAFKIVYIFKLKQVKKYYLKRENNITKF